jgi:hypothetical protein
LQPFDFSTFRMPTALAGCPMGKPRFLNTDACRVDVFQ